MFDDFQIHMCNYKKQIAGGISGICKLNGVLSEIKAEITRSKNKGIGLKHT